MDTRFSMVPLAAFSDRRLTYRQLVVLSVICSFRQGSSDLTVSAGRDEIAERCGLHPSVISAATTDLVNLGWLEKSGRGGRAVKTTYVILIQETVADSVTVTHRATVSKPVTVTKSETVTESVSKTVAYSATPLYRTEKSTDTCAVKAVSVDPDGFADCWSAYPKREGGNSRSDALKAYRGRLKAGASPAEMLAGVRRYAAYCVSKGIVGTSYVKQAATFLGSGDHWQESWTVPTAGPAQDQKPRAGDTRARHGITEAFDEVAGWVPA